MNKRNYLTEIPIIMFIFFILLKPYALAELNSTISFLWKVGLVIISFFIYAIYIKSNKITKLDIALFIYFSVILFSTLLNNAYAEFFISKYMPFFSIVIYCEYVLFRKPENLLKALYYLMNTLAVINLLTIFLYPNGIGEIDHYFLGLDNTASINLIFTAFINWIYGYYNNQNKIKTFVIMLMPLFTLFYVNCSTGIIGSTLVIIFYLSFNRIKKWKILNFRNYIIISIIAFLVFVIFRMQEYFAYIIVDLLGKDLTLTVRTFIWDEVLFIISNNLWLGIGYIPSHAHSTYLDIAYKAGIIGVAFYLNIVRITKNQVKTQENNDLIKIIGYSFLVYFIMTVAELYIDNYLFYVFLALAFHSPIIAKLKKEAKI